MGNCISTPDGVGRGAGAVGTPPSGLLPPPQSTSQLQLQQQQQGRAAAAAGAGAGAAARGPPRSAAAAAAAAATFPADQLEDDTLGQVLGQLPLLHLVQLSTASSRLHQLITQSDKVLQAVDLRTVPLPKLGPALAFLGHHPAADALHTATLPSNCPGSPAALAALTGLASLTLFKAGRQPLPEPGPNELCLGALPHLTSLGLEMEAGDVPRGQELSLPQALCRLSLHAPSLNTALNSLPTTSLVHLTRLTLAVMDGSAAKPLGRLVELPALKDLTVGRFWSVPQALGCLTHLTRLSVDLLGRVVRAPQGSLEVPLSAAACGLDNLPTRPGLHLEVNVSVLAACDGLAPDWACLANLRRLTLDSMQPSLGSGGPEDQPSLLPQQQQQAKGRSASASSGGERQHVARFDLSPLCELNRLSGLSLGFEAASQVVGLSTTLDLVRLQDLVHLKDLSVSSSGRWLHLALEAPRYLTSLLIACEGNLLLAAPGTAAAQAAAAALAAQQSAILSAQQQQQQQQHAAAAAAMGAAGSGSNSPGGGGGSTGKLHHNNGGADLHAVAEDGSVAATGQQQQQQQRKAYAVSTLHQEKQQHGALMSRLLPPSAAAANGYAAAAANGQAAAAAAAGDGCGGSAGGSPLASPRTSFSSADSAASGAGLHGLGGMLEPDAPALLLRRLDKLGSITEAEASLPVDDEVQQLGHIGKLGLLVGGGIRMKDPSVLPNSNCGGGGASRGPPSRTGSWGAGQQRSTSKRLGSRDLDGGGEDVLSLDAWLAAKGLDLSTLQLVQQHLGPAGAPRGSSTSGPSSRQASSSMSRASSLWGGGGGGGGGANKDVGAVPGGGYQVLVRATMEEDVMGAFRSMGFVQ